MATTVAVLEAQLQADTRPFDRAIDRSGKGFQKAGAVIGKAALAAGAAVAAGLAVTAKIGFDEFIEGQRVMAQTNAVIKSTGGVANVTAKHVGSLAESLMKKSGVDDEAIASGQNMLLTFKQIRNETGAGNDIFDQATKATLNLSVAMGKDMSDSAIMVGKALNDPIKGITAMRRVGIQFTQAQEDQIKALVESGQTMKAQKLILKELESQFGGSAEAAGKTLGGQLNILKETFSNTAGEIVGKFIPVLVRFGSWLAPLVLRAFDAIGKIMERYIIPVVSKVAGFFGDLFQGLQSGATNVEETWKNFTNTLTGKTESSFGRISDIAFTLGTLLVSIFHKVREIVKVVFPIIAKLVRDTFTAIGRTLAQHKPELIQIWGVIKVAAQLFGAFLKNVLVPILRFVFTEVLPRVIGIAIKVIAGIITVGEKVRDVLARIRATALFTFEFFRDKAQLVIDKVGAVIQKLRDMVAYIRSIPGKISGALGGIGGFFGDLGAGIGGATRGLRQGVGDFGSFGLGATSLVALGRQLQSMGFHVAEHPAFGGVGGGHAPGSYHYAGRAIDINWPGGGEMAKLDWLNSRLSRMPGVKELLWRTAGHFDHLHLAMAKGGIFTKPWTGMVSVAERGKPEGFVPLPAGGRGLGGLTLNFNAPIYGANESRLAEEIYRLYRRGEATWRQGNGG